MNRGGLGARSLNVELQKALNPAREPRVERFGWTYRVGDKVMQIENDYDKEVFNGDLGVVGAHRPGRRARWWSTSTAATSSTTSASWTSWSLAYAITIHKSQGSEYPAVVIPLTTQHYPMLQRNLLYTGVTRGKRLVVLVGQRKALAIAVRGTADAAPLVEARASGWRPRRAASTGPDAIGRRKNVVDRRARRVLTK